MSDLSLLKKLLAKVNVGDAIVYDGGSEPIYYYLLDKIPKDRQSPEGYVFGESGSTDNIPVGVLGHKNPLTLNKVGLVNQCQRQCPEDELTKRLMEMAKKKDPEKYILVGFGKDAAARYRIRGEMQSGVTTKEEMKQIADTMNDSITNFHEINDDKRLKTITDVAALYLQEIDKYEGKERIVLMAVLLNILHLKNSSDELIDVLSGSGNGIGIQVISSSGLFNGPFGGGMDMPDFLETILLEQMLKKKRF